MGANNGALVPAGEMDIATLGTMLARSGYFQDARDAAQAVVKVLAGRELGFGPVAAMTGIYIVKGRVTLSANMIAAAIKRTGRYSYRVREMTVEACEIEFYEGGQSIGKSRFTLADAKAADLAGGENWRKYPRNMLFARAISNGAKWYCPDVFGGPVYTPDELGQVDDTGPVIEVVPQVVPEPEQPASEPTATTTIPATPPHWTKINADVNKLYEWASTKGLNATAVRQALGVKDIGDYQGSKSDARELVESAAAAKAAGEAP